MAAQDTVDDAGAVHAKRILLVAHLGELRRLGGVLVLRQIKKLWLTEQLFVWQFQLQLAELLFLDDLFWRFVLVCGAEGHLVHRAGRRVAALLSGGDRGGLLEQRRDRAQCKLLRVKSLDLIDAQLKPIDLL